MNKKNILLLIFLAVAVTIAITIAASFYQNQAAPTNEPKANTATLSDAQKFASDYSQVKQDNRFSYVTGEQAVDLLKNGNGMLFLGFKECPWCQSLAPLVDEAAKQQDLQQVYYLDIRQARTDNDSTYQQLVDILRDHLQKDENGEPRIYVPDVTALKDGKIVSRFKQEPSEGQTTPAEFWTDERKERAVVQLSDMIQATK